MIERMKMLLRSWTWVAKLKGYRQGSSSSLCGYHCPPCASDIPASSKQKERILSHVVGFRAAEIYEPRHTKERKRRIISIEGHRFTKRGGLAFTREKGNNKVIKVVDPPRSLRLLAGL